MTQENNIRLPNFICIGVAKAGTTTLHHALLHHPDIFLPNVKETFFFSSDNDYKNGIQWYLSRNFSNAEKYLLKGEIASTYLYHGKKVVKRLNETYKSQPLKLIVVFRDPVHRAYSHYWHMKRLGWENLSFRKALEFEEKRYISHLDQNSKSGTARFAYFESGLYASKLRPFIEQFKKDHFLFILFDDIQKNYDITMKQVLEFIGAPTLALPHEHRNEARMADNHQTMFWNRSPARTKSFIRNITPSGLRHKIGSMLGLHKTRPFKYSPMEKDIEFELRERYKPEIIELSKIIKHDLTHWLP